MRNLKEYIRPASVEEAVALKASLNSTAVYLAGGSDLMVHRPDDIEVVIDIRFCGMGFVRNESAGWVIGGAALLRDVEAAVSPVANGMLRYAVRDTAPWLIRNAATLAGNIANASPAADSVPALLVLDAELELSGADVRRLALREAFLGPHRTVLGNGLIVGIHITQSAAARYAWFIKLARSASDIALVNLAVSFELHDGTMRDVRVALGAVAPIPMRAPHTEAVLEGRPPSVEVLADAARVVMEEVRPISDWRASESYRRRMCGVLLKRAVRHAMPGSVDGEAA